MTLGEVASYLSTSLLRFFIINEESLLAFCCLFHGDIAKLPTVLFIFSVVLYKVKNPNFNIRLPEALHQGKFRPIAKFFELAAHWIIPNVVVSCWHLLYSMLCSYFTTIVAREVEEPAIWPIPMYWRKTVTRTEQDTNTLFPTVLGTLFNGYLIAMIFISGIRERLEGRRQ